MQFYDNMNKDPKIQKTENEWKETLSSDEFCILRKKGTEPPFTGKYVHNKEKGVYICAACGNELFSSEVKFDSGTGWPSFWETLSNDKVELKTDTRHGMKRTEVVCSRCGGHLGHMFEDGPKPTGLRYCINSAGLHFKKTK